MYRTWTIRRQWAGQSLPILFGLSGAFTAASGLCAVALAASVGPSAEAAPAVTAGAPEEAWIYARWLTGKIGFTLAGAALDCRSVFPVEKRRDFEARLLGVSSHRHRDAVHLARRCHGGTSYQRSSFRGVVGGAWSGTSDGAMGTALDRDGPLILYRLIAPASPELETRRAFLLVYLLSAVGTRSRFAAAAALY